MTTPHNPYATPAAPLAPESSAMTVRLYSPAQAAWGAFLGGPVGVVYFLQANFAALGDLVRQRQTVVWGAVAVVALTALILVLPDNVPNAPFTIAYVLVAKQVAETRQMTKQAILDSPRHDFHSNWRVFGMGLLSMLGTAVVMIVPALVLAQLGLVEL